MNALKNQVVGTGPFRLKEPPTTSLWRYERNPDYFKKDLPFLDELEKRLYLADVGTVATTTIVDRVRQAFQDKEITGDVEAFVRDPAAGLDLGRTWSRLPTWLAPVLAR